ncbi:hypothetical protein [Aeromonas sp. R6-2]|uniref:hypothetical protein n=1 Tax=unclassified Aeromonas TaxID=257493 RepID=UPI0034A2E469
MSKYQVLATRPDAPDFTLLEMDSPTFLEEKRQLLEQGLEVVGDISTRPPGKRPSPITGRALVTSAGSTAPPPRQEARPGW